MKTHNLTSICTRNDLIYCQIMPSNFVFQKTKNLDLKHFAGKNMILEEE